MDETQTRIGESARALFATFRDKQVDLAAAMGVSQNAVSRKLNGMTRWSIADVEALAERYGVTVDQVLAGPRAWLGLVDEPGRRDTRQYHPDALSALAA